jgi:hypothetical protein
VSCCRHYVTELKWIIDFLYTQQNKVIIH